MPLITVEEVVSAPIEGVWRTVSAVEHYAEFMESVQQVTVLSREENTTLAAWEVVLKGGLLKWTERETLHPDQHRIEFEQIDGDLEVFDGYWQLFRLDDNLTRAMLSIRFEIGIPMLREMLDPVAERALIENSRLMLRALDTKALSRSATVEG